MGRPSLAAQRTLEILDAFERCVAQFGLDGSSLDRIATEAGMKRSILRHYVGNRDELVQALANRVILKYQRSFQDYLATTEHLPPIDQLMGYLFPSKPISSVESILVIESLIAAGSSSPSVRDKMKTYVDDFVQQVADLLKKAFSEASRKNCWQVAYGIVSLCFNQESLTPLVLPPKYLQAARSSAQILIQSLQ